MKLSETSGSNNEKSKAFAKPSRFATLACVVAFSVLSTGCISVKQYVDPTLPKVAYSDLKPVDSKQSVQVFLNSVPKARPTRQRRILSAQWCLKH